MIAQEGSTLLEMIAVLAILGLVAATVALSLPPRPDSGWSVEAEIASARSLAVRERQPVTIFVPEADSLTSLTVTALPDGGVLADSALQIDRLTGVRLVP